MMHEPTVAEVIARAATSAECARWLVWVDETDRDLAADHPDRQPASGSLRLRALGPAQAGAIVAALWAGPAGARLRARLGPGLVCLSGQCWVRRQFPPALRPAGQHPHAWHQDGALGCRFAPGPAEPLAGLWTLWVPLVDCGDDAPSLEWVDPPSDRLVPPHVLTDAAVQARWGVGARRQARLQAGDGLLFDGRLVHRTHVTPQMQRPRISVELRVAQPTALPARLDPEPRAALD